MRDDEELSAAEIEQMRRFAVIQKTVVAILRRWRWWILAVFFASLVGFSAFVVWHAAKSIHRFDATTRLLYTPRSVEGISNISDKQLMTIVERRSLKRKVGSKMQMGKGEKECLVIDLDVTQERKPTNLFTLTASSPSWKGAVAKVNAYAETLIEEYVAYRTQDLENWKESYEIRRGELSEKIAEAEAEQSVQRGSDGPVAPVEMLQSINQLLSDQRLSLSTVKLQIANEELRRKKFEKAVGGHGDAVMANATVLRRKGEEIAALDADLAKLREIYTDMNPKVLAKLDERRGLIAALEVFLQSKDMGDVDIDDIDRLEKMAGELEDTKARLEVYNENRLSIEHQIAENEKKAAELAARIPAYERLRVQKEDLENSVRDIDEKLGRISYLEASVRSELRQIERAGGAEDKRPFRPKNILLAIIATVFVTGAFAFWAVALEYLFGKVRGGREIAAHDDIMFLGSLPAPGAMGPEDAKEAMGVVSLKLVNVELPRKTILICRLPGANVPEEFLEATDFSLTMSGRSAFMLNVVSAATFEPPEKAEEMIGVVRVGRNGWFPVTNRYAFAPTELEMLRADIEELAREHDLVIISMPDGVRRGGSFFDQMLEVCECALVVAGDSTTPRSWFTYVLGHLRRSLKPIAAIVTGASAGTVRKEMERVR